MGNSAPLRRTWPQRLLLVFNAVLVVACLGAAFALVTFKQKLSDVKTVVIDSPTAAPVEVSEPRNILIIGTDSAANLDDTDPVARGRKGEKLADVIMIMRIDPATGSARLLSIPRDTRVALAPDGDYGRINAAVEGVDGPRNLINTIKRNFGISIDNYVQVDFASFKDLVEQLGGVPAYFAAPVRDKSTGLYVGEPGCVLLGPDQALAYARSRKFQYKDSNGDWRYDQTGDLGRISRQQDFIKRAMRRASDKGIRNPGTAIGIVDAAAKAVVMDDTLTVGTILELVDVFRTFNPDDLETNQIPTVAAPRGGVAYQDVDWDKMGTLLLPFWGYDKSQQLDPKDIIVDVSGTRGDAKAVELVATALDGVGFDADTMVSRRSGSGTTITFGDAGFNAALQLATHLQDTPELLYDGDIIGPRLILSPGDEFQGLREKPIAVDDLPADMRIPPRALRDKLAKASTSDGSGSGGTGQQVTADGTGSSDGSTTTSLPPDADPAFIQAAEAEGAPPGIVPTDPAKAAACR